MFGLIADISFSLDVHNNYFIDVFQLLILLVCCHCFATVYGIVLCNIFV